MQYREQAAPEPADEDDAPNIHREMALKAYGIILAATSFVLQAQTRELGLAMFRIIMRIENRSLTDVAAEHSVAPQAVSKAIKSFCAENDLPTPLAMEGSKSSDAHRKARQSKLA